MIMWRTIRDRGLIIFLLKPEGNAIDGPITIAYLCDKELRH